MYVSRCDASRNTHSGVGPRPHNCRVVAASPALVGISHGTSSNDGQSAIAALMAAVVAAHPGLTVANGFVDVQRPDIPHTLASLGTNASAIVVPLLLYSGYHVHVDLATSIRDSAGRATLARALGPDPRLAQLQCERLEEAGWSTDDTLILAAAGSSDARAVGDCRIAAEYLASESGRPVAIGFVSAASPTLREAIASAQAARPERRITVSSYLLAPGYFQSIVENCGADVVTDPLLAVRRPTPHQLVDIIFDRYRAALLPRSA